MTLPESLRRILPADAGNAWGALAPILPAGLYLGGGTGIAAHLAHRPSQDLDFFFHGDSVELDDLPGLMRKVGEFAVVTREPGTLNGVFSQTRVQFLHADQERPQRRLEPTATIAGIEVAGIGDLLAMKLNAIGGRGALRDYFDVMAIEQETNRTVEEGLQLLLARYGVAADAAPTVVDRTVRALGYLDDLDEDELLPTSKREIRSYWRTRQPMVARAASRYMT